ncbi:MAG: PAS domain S-box protein [Mucilaginibacter sp.]
MLPDHPNKKRTSAGAIDEKLFKLLVARVEDYAIFMLDANGYILSWNQGACRIKGYQAEEIIGKHISVFYTPADTKNGEPRKNLNEALKNGSCEREGLRVRKDGSTFWANIVFTTLYDDDGHLLGFAKVTRDVTKQKEAETDQLTEKANLEAKIKEHTQRIVSGELKFRKLIENNHDGITLLNHNLDIFFRTRSAERINGWASDERIDMGIPDLIHPDDKAALTTVMDTVLLRPEEPIVFTGRYKHRDGHYIWIESTFTNMLTDPDINAVVCNFRDVSHRIRAEEEIRNKADEVKSILESIGDAFFAIDEKQVITYWNHVAEHLFGKEKIEVIGRSLWKVFTSRERPLSRENYRQAIDASAVTQFESYNEAHKRWFEISAYPANGSLSIYLKDITERKNSEIQLKKLNEELRQHAKELAISNAELEQFAYVASHDLQEPLRMVTSFLSQLEKKYSDAVDDKGRQYINFAVDGARRMRQIILDLLEFSRIGRTEHTIEPIETSQVVNEILALYRKQIEEQRAKITLKNLPVVHTYRIPLRQVFQNLISNGLKYQAPGNIPEIEISCADHKDHWEFSVQDNGIGIDSEFFDKIFIIFQRLHNKDEYSGTGMGLAVTKKIIENLGGKISVRSVEGKGSTFYFTLSKEI